MNVSRAFPGIHRLGAGSVLVLGFLLLLSGCDRHGGRDAGRAATMREQPDGVSAPEDLMREHGVLRRLLLTYQECIRRIDAREELPLQTVKDSADIIHAFVEGYHEKLEEDYLFPRFEKAGVLVDLVKTLRMQHQAGRRLTDDILRLANDESFKGPDDRARLARDMREFIRMYGPHSAREDTVLFPTIRQVYSPREFDVLGDTFEDKEREVVGEAGFEKMVEKVADIEKTLGIYDLGQFTPTPDVMAPAKAGSTQTPDDSSPRVSDARGQR